MSEKGIGLIFLVDTLVITFAQLTLAKALEGRHRMPARSHDRRVDLRVDRRPVQGALVADLAPDRLRGRYMAVSATSWEIGFIAGPAVGGFVLAASPLALWPLAATVRLAAGPGALALERGLPRELRVTPAG